MVYSVAQKYLTPYVKLRHNSSVIHHFLGALKDNQCSERIIVF